MTDSLTADEIITAFWFAHSRGIRMRWSPALVAKMAKVNEGKPTRWQEQPQWLRIMPQLTAWNVVSD